MAQLTDFVCDYCHRNFTRKYNLRTHIENCHLYSSSYCGVCDQTFSSPASLAQHQSKGHNRFGQGLPECDYCGRIFKRKQNIVAHMISVHLPQSLDIRCEQCDRTFTTLRNKNRHTRQIHSSDMKYLVCDICKKVFKGKTALIGHIQGHDNSIETDTSTCKLCGKTYTNPRNLRRHTEMHHGAKTEFKCEMCPKSYPSNYSLRRHTRMCHENENTESQSEDDTHITCGICFKAFDSESYLRQHMKIKHSFGNFYNYCKMSLLTKATIDVEKDGNKKLCYVCYDKFSKDNLEEHKKSCKPPEGTKSCDSCEKLFTDPSSLEFHKRIFHSQSVVTSTIQDPSSSYYNCDLCSRVYNSDRSLKHHMKLKHSTEKAVSCQMCGKVCNNKYYLESHMKIVHSRGGWTSCTHCRKLFKSKRNLRRHIEFTHLGQRRYKCLECDTLFKEKRSLRKHVRTKHPDSSVFPSCHVCGKRFESAKSCKIHLKLVHSLKLDTHACHLCSGSFVSYKDLSGHIQNEHSTDKVIMKCELCNLVFEGEAAYDRHNVVSHLNMQQSSSKRPLPRCVLCMKDFSSTKTLKRHIKKFHNEFDADELAGYGARKAKVTLLDCDDCVRRFNDDFYNTLIEKQTSDAVVFKCDLCDQSYTKVEFLIQRHRFKVNDVNRIVFSELCTTEMGYVSGDDLEPESTTNQDVIEINDELDST